METFRSFGDAISELGGVVADALLRDSLLRSCEARFVNGAESVLGLALAWNDRRRRVAGEVRGRHNVQVDRLRWRIWLRRERIGTHIVKRRNS
jgi:hypothetical protein